MKKDCLLIVIVLLMHVSATAQVTNGIINTQQVRARISMVDEFLKRFNGTEDRPDMEKGTENYDVKRMLLLFDGKMFSSEKDSAFGAAIDFVNTVIDNKTRLNFSDTTWFAKARCHGVMNKKDVDFTLYLSVEERGKNLYKWVINKAEGEIFNLTPHSVPKRIMIGPEAHEVKFLELRHITKGQDDRISCYLNKNKQVDATSVFLSYVYNGMLDIEYVSDLEFIFFEVPNYIFAIKDFTRKTLNSGWLIKSFSKMSDDDKEKLLKSIKY